MKKIKIKTATYCKVCEETIREFYLCSVCRMEICGNCICSEEGLEIKPICPDCPGAAMLRRAA